MRRECQSPLVQEDWAAALGHQQKLPPFCTTSHAYGCRPKEGAIGDREGTGAGHKEEEAVPGTPSHQISSGLQLSDIENI